MPGQSTKGKTMIQIETLGRCGSLHFQEPEVGESRIEVQSVLHSKTLSQTKIN